MRDDMHANDQTIPTSDDAGAASTESASTATPTQPNETKSVTNNPNSVTNSDDNATDKTDTTETKEPETPDWFMKDKFKTIEDQARSSKNVVGKMGKFWGSPEDSVKPD